MNRRDVQLRRARMAGGPSLPLPTGGGFNPITVCAILVLLVAGAIALILLLSAGAEVLTEAVGLAWIPLAVFLIIVVGAYVLWAGRRKAARSEWEVAGRCTACGYDLRATADQCPECGTPLPADLERRRRLATPLPAAEQAALRRRLVDDAGQ